MKRFAVLGSISFLLLTSPAQAGFQWMPPENKPAPVVSAPSQMASPSSMNAFPAEPVMSEPLNNAMPTSILPENYSSAPYKTGQRPQRFKGDALVIDPYPLRNDGVSIQARELTESSVQQAMIEESQALRPLQLGAGMKTGAQPTRAITPSAYTISSNEMMMAANNIPRGPAAGITPMMGGEPAPLPGTGAANRRMDSSMGASMNTTQINNYSNAVGFGKDLPLALALSQIIPPEFTHSYAVGVNAGTEVDWEGGKPWNVTLEEMLRPHNMTASIQGNQVIITPMATL